MKLSKQGYFTIWKEGDIITMDNIFNKEHKIIEVGTFHNTKGDNKMTKEGVRLDRY